MKFNRDKFYSAYKKHFGKISPIQFEGLERLLTGFETYYGWWDSIPQIANAFAQVKWETAHSFHPVVEGYYLGDPKALNFYVGNTDYVRRFQRSLRYYPHFGRGDIQLTWEENYEEQDAYMRQYFPEVVRDFERRTGQTFNLIKHPEQVLDGWISFCIMTVGMHKGTFRDGQTLDRHINLRKVDHYAARNIVNGDAGKKVDGVKIGVSITKIAEAFENILRFSLDKSDSPNELTADNVGEELDKLNLNSTSPDASGTGSLPAVAYPDNSASDLSATPSVDPNQSEPDSDDSNTVRETIEKKETPTNDGGTKTVEESNITLPGDAPDAAPKSWFNVEDWKPWVFRKLKLTGKSFAGFNMTQGTANLYAAMKSGEYWYIPLVISLAIFLLTLLIAAGIAVVLLLIWYFNRREIKEYKQAELDARHDPNKYNFGLKFQKIGERVQTELKPLLGDQK